jgi:hypothetical protein
VFTANFRSFFSIGLQIGSPSKLTSTAGVWLKKIFGGSALRPGTSFGLIVLLSTNARTRSSAMMRSFSGIALVISATVSLRFSFGRFGKFASTMRILAKLTSRSSSDTCVCASICNVPSEGLDVADAPGG